MRRFAVAVITALAATTALAQPFVERQISTPVYVPAGSNEPPAIASNGTDFLVVWNGGLNAARISRNGELLDPAGIRLPAPLYIANKAISGVFWVNDAWVIVYSYSDFTDSQEITAVVRINAAGEILDGPRVVLDGVRIPAGAAATNGSTIVLAYGSVTILDSTAHVIASNVQLPQVGSFRYAWSVASNGSGFLIAWSDLVPLGGYVLNFAAVTGDGVIKPASSVYVAPPTERLAMASDGENYVIVLTNGNDGIAYAQRVDRDGVALERVTLPYRFDDLLMSRAAIVWSGSMYLVAAFDTRSASYGLSAFKLDDRAQPIGSSYSLPIDALPAVPVCASLASNGTTTAVARLKSGDVSGAVAVTFLASDGMTRLADDIIALSVNAQYDPAFARGASTDLVVWSEPGGIYATRISRSGQPLDGRGFNVAQAGPYPAMLQAVYDVTTNSFAVLVQNNNDFFNGLKRIDAATGAVTQTISLGECWFRADVFADDHGVLAAGNDCDGTMHLTRLASDGRADGSIIIPGVGLQAAVLSIASNGSEYLAVVYVSYPNTLPIPEIPPRGALYAIRVTTDLHLIDAQPFPIVDTRSVSASYPLAASDGKDFLIVWDNNGTDIGGRYVSRDGTLLNGTAADDGIQLSGVASDPTNLVFDGVRYAFGSTQFNYDGTTSAYITRAARVPAGPSGTVKLNSDSSHAERPSVISRGDGRIAVAYSRTADDPPFSGVSRVFVGEERPSRIRSVRH